MNAMGRMSLVGLVVAGLAVFAIDCATTQPGQQALVCPQCKTVYISDDGSESPSAFGRGPGVHHCPGCQGSMRTWLKEGKFEHKCSICQEQGYVCAGHAW